MSIIREYHHVVADQFYKGLGVALMRKESDVMVELLLELKRQHIVALPIHDGVLVADGVHEQTLEIMEIVFITPALMVIAFIVLMVTKLKI